MMGTGKVCVRCDEHKPRSDFNSSKSNRDGLHSWCRPCFRSYLLTKRYGLTLTEFDRQVEAQYNACALCTQDFTADRRPVVDHDHSTGFIRGVICSSCNTALGLFQDQPELLRAASLYLEAPPGLWTGHSQN